MGHLVNPVSFRLGKVIFWRSNYIHFRQKVNQNKYFFYSNFILKILNWIFSEKLSLNFFFFRFKFYKKKYYLIKNYNLLNFFIHKPYFNFLFYKILLNNFRVKKKILFFFYRKNDLNKKFLFVGNAKLKIFYKKGFQLFKYISLLFYFLKDKKKRYKLAYLLKLVKYINFFRKKKISFWRLKKLFKKVYNKKFYFLFKNFKNINFFNKYILFNYCFLYFYLFNLSLKKEKNLALKKKKLKNYINLNYFIYSLKKKKKKKIFFFLLKFRLLKLKYILKKKKFNFIIYRFNKLRKKKKFMFLKLKVNNFVNILKKKSRINFLKINKFKKLKSYFFPKIMKKIKLFYYKFIFRLKCFFFIRKNKLREKMNLRKKFLKMFFKLEVNNFSLFFLNNSVKINIFLFKEELNILLNQNLLYYLNLKKKNNLILSVNYYFRNRLKTIARLLINYLNIFLIIKLKKYFLKIFFINIRKLYSDISAYRKYFFKKYFLFNSLKFIRLKSKFKEFKFLKEYLLSLNNIILKNIFKQIFFNLQISINYYFFSNVLLNAKVIYLFIKKQLSLNKSITKILKIIKLELKRFDKFQGFKILMRGRFTRKERAFNQTWIFGKLPTSSIIAPLDYYSNIYISRFGVGSIRIWLFKKK